LALNGSDSGRARRVPYGRDDQRRGDLDL